MTRTIISLILMIVVGHAFGHSDRRLARLMVEDAERILEQKGSVKLATDKLVLAAELQPEWTEVNYKAGYWLLQTSNRNRSFKYLERVYLREPDYRNILFLMGLSLKHSYRFEEALEFFNQALEKETEIPGVTIRMHIADCETAAQMIRETPRYRVQNMGNRINSAYPDYAPAINLAGDYLVFTSRRYTDNTNQDQFGDGLPFEEIYYAVRNDSAWESARNIGESVNTPSHDSNLSLSADGQHMLIYSGRNNGDIMISSRDENGIWTRPVPVRGINSKYAEKSACFVNSRDQIIFSSDRPGTLGGLDLYYAEKGESGYWTRPVNLGERVNTKEFEDAPFFDPKRGMLFFSSDGRPGMGGFDIWQTRYDSAKGAWEDPANIGIPINSTADDLYFFRDSTRIYFTSDRSDGLGMADIYEAEEIITPREDRDRGVHLQVLVRSSVDSSYLDASVTVDHLISGSRYPAQRQSAGRFKLDLPPLQSDSIRISIEKDGFLYQIADEVVKDEMKLAYYLIPIREARAVRLDHIYFEFNSANLAPTSYFEIDQLEKLLAENPHYHILIEGHTDTEGEAAYNQRLSESRARTVAEALIARGIAEERIEWAGWGETRPLANGDLDREQARINRRVEFSLIIDKVD